MKHRSLLLLTGLATLGILLAGALLNRLGLPFLPQLAFVEVPKEYALHHSDTTGFSLRLPPGLKVDEQLEPLCTRFTGEGLIIDVYRQSEVLFNTYIGYGNRAIMQGIDPVQILKHTRRWVGLKPVTELWWQRPDLPLLSTDLPFYASIDIVTGLHTTYSVLVRAASQDMLSEVVPILVRSFKTLTPDGSEIDPVASPEQTKRASPLAEVTRAYIEDNFYAETPFWGIFQPAYPQWPHTLAPLEETLGYDFPLVLFYTSFDSQPPLASLNTLHTDGKTALLTLQTTSTAGRPLTYEILSGQYDDFLREYAGNIAQFAHPVLFRLNNEMNGDWCTYSAYFSSKDPMLFIATWRYVFDIFTQEGATNAAWVWNPHDLSFPDFTWNHALAYYPGSEYVDVIGLTGYNTGTYYPGESWRSFAEIYDPLYAEYDRLFPGYPMLVTEFGSAMAGGDRSAWLEEMFDHIPNYPRIAAYIWWNHIDYDGATPARTYRIDPGDPAWDVFSEGLQKHSPSHR